MYSGISRRALILIACLASAAWAGLAQASPQSFTVPLTGAEQVPAVETAGTGSAALTYDPATRVVTWTVTYSGLSGPASLAVHQGQFGREPIQGRGHADARAGSAIRRRRVVRQRAHAGASGR